jgi:3-carboxy-cis,cis-muconate lactonizing enzyme.
MDKPTIKISFFSDPYPLAPLNDEGYLVLLNIMVYKILVASYTDEISTLSFDPQSNSLTTSASHVVGQNPSWISSYPGDPSLVFVALEQPQGKAILVNYDKAGNWKVVGEVPSGGEDPCSLLTTKDELFIANVRLTLTDAFGLK